MTAGAKPRFSSFRSTTDARVALGERGEVLARAVGRAVVDHDQLEVGVVGVEQDALDAEPREGEAVGRDDDDRGVVPAPSEPVAAGVGDRAAERRLDVRLGQSVVGRRETGVEVERRRAAPRCRPRRAGSATPTSSSSRPSTTSRVEVLARELERRLTRLRVVGLDRLDRRDGLVDRREREQRLAGRQHVAEAGVLGDDRAAGGEVGRAAVAEPAASAAARSGPWRP